MPTVLCISDLHAPFHHPDSLDFLVSLNRRIKPDHIVCLGDLGDQFGWSRHPRSPDGPGQAEECKSMLVFCHQLYKLFPRAKACIGNHDTRLAKACVRAGLPSHLYRTIPEVYQSPKGWTWADTHVIDGIAFQHGEGYSGKDAALKCARDNRVSTAIGHVHSAAGVQYVSGAFNTIWGLASGCMIDPASPGFDYAKRSAARPVLGTSAIIDGVPHFFPMGA